jgi:outer membrane protein TolC
MKNRTNIPSEFLIYFQLKNPIPDPPSEVTASFPVENICQRQDICKAQRQLAAQMAMIGIKTADLCPWFSLLGSFSFPSFSSDTLRESASRSFNYGPL